MELLHSGAEQGDSCFIGLCILVNHPFSHLGITMHTFHILETCFLNVTGLDDPFTNGGR